MISGWVSREWARHHYRHWYDEHFGHLEHAAHAEVSAEPAPSASVALPASPALPALAPQPAAALPAVRPVKILWPPDARAADPSFAS
jgi:hypothetical protein